MLNWLLIFVPVAIGLEFLMPGAHTPIFIAACLAVVPLAGWLGHATEELAHRTGEGVGELLNATPAYRDLMIEIASRYAGSTARYEKIIADTHQPAIMNTPSPTLILLTRVHHAPIAKATTDRITMK